VDLVFPRLRDANGVGCLLRLLLAILVLLGASFDAGAACIDPATLAHSIVSITRHFDDKEAAAQNGTFGIRGTGWFLSPTLIVTVEHVATAMNLSDQDWKAIDIGDGAHALSVPVRIQRVVGSKAERIAVLELQTAFSGVHGLPLRQEPFVAEEPIVSLAYPNRQARAAAGRFVEYGASERVAGMALLEMYDRDDRLVLDHGSSGAPVLDCNGRVGATVSNLITASINFPTGAVRVSTAWGSANVVSVPMPVLQDLTRAQ
jgi:Trypsin-like peptidase domain